MVDNVKSGDRKLTLINKINDAIDALNTDITDLSTNYLNKTTATAQTVTSKVTVSGGLVATTFCMGDNTTPVTTYATDVNTTTGESLATTQAELDKVIAACNAVGILNVT